MNQETDVTTAPFSKLIFSKPFVIFVISVLCVYAKYYYDTVFGPLNGTALNIDMRPPPNGPGMWSVLWTLFKFVGLYGGPFGFAAFYFKGWRLINSATVSFSVWAAVYLYMYVFHFSHFRQLYPDSSQCLIVLISVYPLMGISLFLGHSIGSLLRRV
jgi:hypothetical protein